MSLARCSFAPAYRWSLVLVASLAVPLASAQSVRLNRALPRGGSSSSGGDVGSPRLSPDGQWAVYVADPVDGVLELFSVPVDGSTAPRRLNGAFAPGMGLGPTSSSIAISPTSERVVYVADQATDGAFELWSAPIDGSSTAVRICGAFPPGAGIRGRVQFTPGGERVVYLADPAANDVNELWSTPVDGSQAPVRLNAPAGDLPFDSAFAVMPDGSGVIYVDDQATPGVVELWHAPIDGSAPAVRVHPPLALSADVAASFQISSDSTRVVYRADAATDGMDELWSVPLDGSTAPVNLNGPLTSNADVFSFEVAPDSSSVLYQVDATVDNLLELFWVDIAGGLRRRLSGILLTGSDVSEFAFTADGLVAVFAVDAEVDDFVNLYSRPVDLSGPRRRLNDPLAGELTSSWEITPDGTRVVYLTQDGSGFRDLWSVPVDGSSAPIRLEQPGQGGLTGVEGFRMDPAGAWVAYSLPTPLGQELWSVPVDRSLAPRALQRARHLRGFFNLSESLTSTRAVFVADANMDSLQELWSRPLDASQLARRLSQELAPDPIIGDVNGYAWSADGTRVVYRADDELDDRHDLIVAPVEPRPRSHTLRMPDFSTPPRSRTLWANVFEPPIQFHTSPDGRWAAWRSSDAFYAAPLDGSLPAQELATSTTSGRSIAIAPDSTRVVAVGNTYGIHDPLHDALLSLSIDGQTPPLYLNASAPGNETLVPSFAFSPDAARVAYLEVDDGAPSLRSTRLDGTVTPKVLQPALEPGRTIDAGFQVSPDGSQVVFVSDRDTAGVLELLSVPMIGDEPVRLHPPLATDRDVDRAFRISPDGTRVVYAADPDVDQEFELFSTSILGDSSPVQLSGTMAAGGDVGLGITRPGGGLPLAQFELSPDGTRVVYLADQDTDEVFELYSVPIDGSAPAVRLHAALAPAGDVAALSTRISSDGQTVVYAADALEDEQLELFAVPIDASAAPVPLAGPFVSGGGVWTRPGLGAWQALEITPSGAHVVYMADQDTDEVFELYAVRLDGSTAPEKLNSPLVAGGDVRTMLYAGQTAPPFRLSPSGGQVAYLADERADEVVELFQSWID